MDTNMTDTMKTWLRNTSEDDVRKALTSALAALADEKSKAPEDPIDEFRKCLMNTWNKRRARGEDIDETDVAAIMIYYFSDAIGDAAESAALMEPTATKVKESKEAFRSAAKFFSLLRDKLINSEDFDEKDDCIKSEETDEDVINAFLDLLK